MAINIACMLKQKPNSYVNSEDLLLESFGSLLVRFEAHIYSNFHARS